MVGDSNVLDKTAIIAGAAVDLVEATVVALAQVGFRVIVGTMDATGHAESATDVKVPSQYRLT